MDNISLINFTDLTMNEKLMVLSWRNTSSIKKWMYTSEDISVDEHLAFIDALDKKINTLYFIVKQKGKYLGVIDFTNIEKGHSVTMGIYINPELKGLGPLFMEVIIDFSFQSLKVKKIKSEVFADNTKACMLYEKFGFKFSKNKVINERNVICMELENEYRKI